MVLLLFSVVSWAIIIYKWRVLNRAQKQSAKFLEIFWQSKKLDVIFQECEDIHSSPICQLFRTGYTELKKLKRDDISHSDTMHHALGSLENVNRSLRRAITTQITYLESLVPFLATTGSTSPFIGLFGTVIGIMKSFHQIGVKGSANLATVAPGISEALIATAVGLGAAIPAVVAYNYFLSKIKVLDNEMETFSNDFLNIIKRHFLKS